MEKVRRESILLGYSPQISFGNPASSSPRISEGSSDIDFNDVFGGPPRRRSSISDGRYSLNETDSLPTKQDAEPVASRNLWSGLSDKPVFGEEPVYARRHPGDGFFDDIFKSEESDASTPKRHDREPFSPMASSLVLSPVRPLPPNPDTFDSPSLAANFSLPARVARGIDFSSLGSATHSRENHSYSPFPTSSSPSSQAPADAKHNIQSFYQSSLSSPESNQNREEPSLQGKTDGTKVGSNLEKVFKNGEDFTNQGQFPFHFSIYKWANKEVSFTMPPTRGHVSKLKQTAKTRRCSSSNGRMGSENKAMQSPTPSLSNSERPSSDHPLTSKDSFKLRPEKEERDFSLEVTNQQSKNRPQTIEELMLYKPQPEKTSNHHKTADRGHLHHLRREAKYARAFGLEDSIQNKQKPSQIMEEPVLSKSESKKASSVQETVDCAPLKHSKSEDQVNSFVDIKVSEKTEKDPPEFTKVAINHESQSARSANDNKAKGDKETLTLDIGSVTKAKIDRRSPLSFENNKISKKDDGKATMARKTEAGKSSSQSSSSNSGVGADGRRVGKVKEFVKIFNQDQSSSPTKADVDNHSPSSYKQKQRGNFGATIEVCADARTDLKVPLQNINNTAAHVSVKVDELSKQSPKEQQPAAKTDSHRNKTQRSEQNIPADSIPEDSNITVVDVEETFQENFLIEELPPDEIKQTQMQNDREELRAIDDKIRQWSRGKEGNIRSLLSTLQYVLWPQSGWKPVPLVDIIDGNAVKRSYQRALLCLHPDKLQQRGVTSQQKYTAEKVFDILQEAWNLFSSLGLP